MKTLSRSLFTGLLLILANSNTFAAGSGQFVMEPSVGYRNETVKLTDLVHQEKTLKSAVPVFGLKLGYQSMLGVDLNLAYDFSKGKMEVSSLTEKNDFTHQTSSLQLGISALGQMKIYLGYAFLNDLKLDDSPSMTGFKLSGPAYIAGLQFKLFPHLNLGAQYNLNQFKKITGSAYALSDDSETHFSKIDTQDYSLYLSLDF